jgi:hypothetical protein
MTTHLESAKTRIARVRDEYLARAKKKRQRGDATIVPPLPPIAPVSTEPSRIRVELGMGDGEWIPLQPGELWPIAHFLHIAHDVCEDQIDRATVTALIHAVRGEIEIDGIVRPLRPTKRKEPPV